MKFLLTGLLFLSGLHGAIVRDVRDALNREDSAAAQTLLDNHRKQHGTTPEWLEAYSWLGRAALAARKLDAAESYAQKTYDLAAAELRKRPLDQERHLPIALGAAIEVQAQVMAQRNERSAAVDYLRRELKTYYNTSIRTRIQKNINLLSLEGKPAPPIPSARYIGKRPPALTALRGKPVLVFLWAHWCSDCKSQAPVLARIQKEYGNRLAILAPTQRYGYAAKGEDATPAAELKYIAQIRAEHYEPHIPGLFTPVSEETFKNYGASTTPTLVLIDGKGIVRMYHPGKMTYEELKAHLDRL
jgi:thiol-disulfide isomerase/thioredoxin